jgi:peptidyl-prolyl cis-trans isomerase SurA
MGMNNKIKLIIVFSLLLLSTYLTANELDQIAAIVNKQAISLGEVQLRAKALQAINKNYANQSPEVIQKQALEDLILERLQLEKAESLNLSVSNALLNSTIQDYAQAQQQDLATFKQSLAQSGMSFEAFQEQTHRNLLLESLRKQIQGQIKISRQDMEDLIASQSESLNQGERFHLQHILLTTQANNTEQVQQHAEALLQRLNAGEDFAQVAHMESASYAAQQGGDLGWQAAKQLPDSFNGALALMDVNDISGVLRDAQGFHIIKLLERQGGNRKLTPTMRTRHILVSTQNGLSDAEAEQKIRSIYQQLSQGKSFAQLAKQYSDDPGSAAKGGDLGWLKPGQTVAEFEQVMANTPLNAISQPFKSSFGWHIVQVLEHKQTDTTTSMLKSKAGAFLQTRKAEEHYQAWLQNLRSQAHIEYRLPLATSQLQLQP